MYRTQIEHLYAWKEKEGRKPLIIQGARQVGKTWLMKEFGKEAFTSSVYVNFDSNDQMKRLFSSDITNIPRIISGLELYFGKKIDKDTLIIFDEIQEVPEALSSLKYFAENAPEYAVISAGSLLGMALHQGTSFPVGKVEFMKLEPLTYKEFLSATGRARYAQLLESMDWNMVTSFNQTYIGALREYYYVGGMPEAVSAFSKNADYPSVRTIQKNILLSYEQDFSKHAPVGIVPRLRQAWNSIPSQLAKENQKFIYGLIREGARAKEYEKAIMWLTDCSLAIRLGRVGSGELPLKAYEDIKSFKLFLCDIGLLCCMVNLDARTLLDGNALFSMFKGALTEQYVCQQLQAIPYAGVYYYTNDRSSCEVDFVLDLGSSIVPLEVKAETNLKAKSLKTYQDKYNIPLAVRSSMTDYKKEERIINLPLYAIGEIVKTCTDQK